jgi:hypothetical protein
VASPKNLCPTILDSLSSSITQDSEEKSSWIPCFASFLLSNLESGKSPGLFSRFELVAVRDDVDYLRRRYFDDVAVADLAVSLQTRQRRVDTILGLFRYRLCALEERAMLEAHARQAARISSRPVYVLCELVDLLRRERVVLPGYTFLQDVVREALAFERKRLAGALEGLIGAEDAKSLDRLRSVRALGLLRFAVDQETGRTVTGRACGSRTFTGVGASHLTL